MPVPWLVPLSAWQAERYAGHQSGAAIAVPPIQPAQPPVEPVPCLHLDTDLDTTSRQQTPLPSASIPNSVPRLPGMVKYQPVPVSREFVVSISGVRPWLTGPGRAGQPLFKGPDVVCQAGGQLGVAGGQYIRPGVAGAATVARFDAYMGDEPEALQATGTMDANPQQYSQQLRREAARPSASRRDGGGLGLRAERAHKPLCGAEKHKAPRRSAGPCEDTPCRTRTCDPLIKSQLLYQLS